MLSPNGIIGAQLLDVYCGLKNGLESFGPAGDSLVIFLEELQLTLDVPLVVLLGPRRFVGNVLESEYRYVCAVAKRAEGPPKEVSTDCPFLWSCMVDILPIEALRYCESDRRKIALRSRILDIQGVVTLTFNYKNEKDRFLDRIEFYLDRPQFERAAQVLEVSVNAEEVVAWFSRCIDKITTHEAKARAHGLNQVKRSVSRTRLVDSLVSPHALSRTKELVEKNLPLVHDGFKELRENSMLLQFFVVDSSPGDTLTLKHIPTEDQISRYRDVESELAEYLKGERVEGAIGATDPVSLVTGYRWDAQRSFTAYACTTRCTVYSSNWREEPLIKGVHLEENERKRRELVSVAMALAQRPGKGAKSVLLTIPWVVGQDVIGALQVNATQELPIGVRKEAAGLTKRIFNLSEAGVQFSEALGEIKAFDRVRGHLLMLGHDVPKFFSGPTLTAVNSVRDAIEKHRVCPSAISEQKVIEEVSIQLARVRTLAVHYNALFQVFLGNVRFGKAGQLSLEEHFKVSDCIDEVKAVFGVLHKQAAVTAVTSEPFSPFAKSIELDADFSQVQNATIRGAKALLVEAILNLVSNSLDSLIAYPHDSTRNPVLLDPNRGRIVLTVSADAGDKGTFLKIEVKDQGIGIEREILSKIWRKIDNIEAKISLGASTERDVLADKVTTKAEHLGAGLSIVLEILLLLGSENQFNRPTILTQPGKGTRIEIWFPVNCISW